MSVLRFLKLKKEFKKMSFLLRDGIYIFNGSNFRLKNNNEKASIKNMIKTVKVKNSTDDNLLCVEGRFYDTMYKHTIVSKTGCYYLYKDKDKYFEIKNKITEYSNKLFYQTMKSEFDDDKLLMTSNYVDGEVVADDDHFWMFFDYYTNHIQKKTLSNKTIMLCNKEYNMPYCYQHGDCHSKNIFWKDNEFTLIDLDDIDCYPIMYDVIYFALSLKHEEAINIFNSEIFINAALKNSKDNEISNNGNVVDILLAAYIQFWVSKMNEDTPYYETFFYLRWLLKADLTNYPLSLSMIELYYTNLKLYNIKE